MRSKFVWPSIILSAATILIVAGLAFVHPETVRSALQVERLGLQSENAGREAQGTRLDIAPQAKAVVTYPDAFGTVASLKDLPAIPLQTSSVLARDFEPSLPQPEKVGQTGPDAVAQTWSGPKAMPTPIASFDGISLADQFPAAFSPPDTNGDIGYDPATGKHYYFQWINLSYKAWDVTNPNSPVVVVPRTAGNALWVAAMPGSQCAQNNDGDPITLFDEQAHRWFISQFSVGANGGGPYHQCVAVSQTADPSGAWYVYDYQYRDGSTYFNDYPHFGVWPDPTYNAYFMTIHEFNSAGDSYLGQSVSAFERAKLLVGDSSAALVTFGLGTSYGGMLPADLDGAPPAAGTPGFFFMTSPGGTLQIWEFRPDWTTPANSTVGVGGSHTANYSLPITSYTDACSGGNCDRVPQSGTAQTLDSLGNRLMHRVAFRLLDGGIQTAVLNHTVDVDGSGGSDRTGIRWYELRRNSATGTWSVNQQSTYAPGSTDYRWMGSIATDHAGDIAIGFSVSSTTTFPSISYVGRYFTDTLSTMPQAETTLFTGLGSQTGSDRWGDYSNLSVDPQDGCTFWYTQEYNGSTAGLPWKTRIGTFKFPNCIAIATGNLTGIVRDVSDNSPINAATVTALSSMGIDYPSTTDTSGIYHLIGIPVGTYTSTVAASGYYSDTITGIQITLGLTTTQNYSLTSLLSSADLMLTKTASATQVDPGDSLTYTLDVTNNGPAAITSTITVTDMLPAGYSLGGAAGSGWTCAGMSTIICTRTGLTVTASATVMITGTTPFTNGVYLTNQASVTSDYNDPVPGNNTGQATTLIGTLPTYGLDLAPSAAGQTGDPGTILTYTLAVTNTGDVTDTFSVMVSGNTFTTTAPASIGPLAAGASATIEVSVTVPLTATAGTLDTATVAVTSMGDNLVSASATLTTTVTPLLEVYLPVVERSP